MKSINDRYNNDETDEFLKPIILNEEGAIQDNDSLLFFNFRSDRMRQLTQTIGKIDGVYPFKVEIERNNLTIVTMTQYKSDFPFKNLFPPQSMNNVNSGLIWC